MSISSDIVDRLKDKAPIFDGRADIARSINNPMPTALPEVWVHRWTEIASPNQTTNFTVQSVSKEVMLLVATEHEANDGFDPAEAAETQVFAALIDQDFTVGGSNWPLEYARKEIVESAETHQLFRLTFRYIDYVRG